MNEIAAITVAQNNGLHQTGARGVALSYSSEGQSFLGAPAGVAECSAYLEVRTHLNGQAIAVGARTGQMEPKESSSGKDPDPNQGKVL